MVQNENNASPFYLVLGLIILVLVAGATALSLSQYLDYEQKVKIYEYIPGLPHAK